MDTTGSKKITTTSRMTTRLHSRLAVAKSSPHKSPSTPGYQPPLLTPSPRTSVLPRISTGTLPHARQLPRPHTNTTMSSTPKSNTLNQQQKIVPHTKVGDLQSFKFLKTKYPSLTSPLNKFTQLHISLSTKLQQQTFLIKCRNNQIFPKFIHNSLNTTQFPRSHKLTSLHTSFKKSLLNLQISSTIKSIHLIRTEISKLSSYLSTQLCPDEFSSVLHQTSSIYNTSTIRTKNKLMSKFLALSSHPNNSKTYPSADPHWIHNISSEHNIPSYVHNILALGPNFSTPISKPTQHIPKLLTDLEHIHRDITLNPNNEERDISRHRVCNIITNHLQNPSTQTNHLPSQFYTDLKHTRSFLKTKQDLIITRADKGNKTVIMNKTDYTDKMNTLLSDTNTYIPTPHNKDPTPSLTTKFNSHLKHLYNSQQIDKQSYYRLISYNSLAPRIYGLPKIHKPNNPLRPIVSNINSPASKLSKFLLPPLQILSHDNPYDVNNSFDLKLLLKSINIPPTFILASLDAESLFTNIPIDTALHIINRNWDKIQPHTSLSQDSFLSSLTLCSKSGYLTFQGKFFNQVEGLAMGNCLAPDLSNIVLNDLLDSILPLFPNDILFLKKYVDDLLLILNPNRIPDILSSFNSYHPRLKFTVKVESNNSLPFLDLLLIHNSDGSLSTNWYTKPTYSGRLLHYLSSHPHHQKTNVARNLIHRSLSLSDPTFHSENVCRLTSILQSNGFPIHIIRNLINQFQPPPTPLSPPSSQPSTSSEHPNPNQFRSLPYIPHLSEKITKTLRSTFPTLKPGFSSTNKLRSLYTYLKDPIPLSHRSNVVYRIPCSTPQCNKTYVGETKNHITKRLNTHKYTIKNKLETTALAKHALTDNHTFDFDNYTILSTETNYHKRLISETIHIHLQDNPVNYKTDKDRISPSYANIFHLLKNK